MDTDLLQKEYFSRIERKKLNRTELYQTMINNCKDSIAALPSLYEKEKRKFLDDPDNITDNFTIELPHRISFPCEKEQLELDNFCRNKGFKCYKSYTNNPKEITFNFQSEYAVYKY